MKHVRTLSFHNLTTTRQIVNIVHFTRAGIVNACFAYATGIKLVLPRPRAKPLDVFNLARRVGLGGICWCGGHCEQRLTKWFCNHTVCGCDSCNNIYLKCHLSVKRDLDYLEYIIIPIIIFVSLRQDTPYTNGITTIILFHRQNNRGA